MADTHYHIHSNILRSTDTKKNSNTLKELKNYKIIQLLFKIAISKYVFF